MRFFPFHSPRKFVEWMRGFRFKRAERRANCRPWLETLEARLAPANVTWSNAGSGDWDVPGNWSTGRVPGAGDAVIINTASAATITIQAGDNISVQSVTTASRDTLSITGGALTVTAGASTLSGPLSMTGGTLTATGSPVTWTANGTTTVSQASLYAQGGATLSLPHLTNYAAASGSTFEASGANSVLNVSALNDVTQASGWVIQADGGKIDLASLTSLDASTGQGDAVLNDTNNGSILDGKLATLKNVAATLDGTDAKVANAWTQFKNGNLDITGGSYTLASLTNVDGSDLSVSSSGQLTLAGLTSYAANGTFFQVSGAGVLDAPALTTVTHTGAWTLNADGGLIQMNRLSDLVLAAGDTLNISAGATLDFANATATTPTGNGATFNVPQLPQGVLVEIGITVDYTSDVTFNVGPGAIVSIYGSGGDAEFLGGATFNVGSGASVDLTATLTATFGGTLTGSGSGTVQLASGFFYPAIGGVTLDFPGSMFQWTGGYIETAEGDVTNLGTINLAGPNDKGLFEDGTLYNYGTMIQTGAGNLDLHSDNVFPTTLFNEAGGSYLLDGDSGIDNFFGGAVAVQNDGTIQKTAGTGTSFLTINGPLSNTGVIEADSGTLYLDANSIAQVSGGTLTGGAWNAFNGAILELPLGTAITSNAGSIALGGAALILGIGGLTANSGSFTIGSGATFNATGDLSNSGTITLAGTLNVAGDFTQSADAVIDEQIGGAASNQLGQLGIAGSATLDGAIHLELVNGFSPTTGQNFFVIFFSGVAGDFTAVTGLGANFTAALNSANLELTYAATASADLALTSVVGPGAATDGQPITVTWQVTDNSVTPALGPWQDSVYLSPTASITSSSVYLGAVPYAAGLVADQTYTGTFTGAVPALAPGNYFLLVEADSLYQVADSDRTNNVLAANNPVAVSVPPLNPGSSISGSFTAGDQDEYYQVSAPAGGALQIALTSAAGSGATAVYVSEGSEPTPFQYQWGSAVAGQPNQTVTVPQVAAPATYYVLVHSISGAAAVAGYTLTATQTGALTVSAPRQGWTGGNGGNLTIEIDGTNFTATTTAALTLNTMTIAAASIDFVSASQIFATFDLAGAATGSYALTVQQGAQTITAPASVQVVPATNAGALQFNLITPAAVRAGRAGVVQVMVTNVSNNDVPAPLLILDAGGDATLNLPGDTTFTPTSLTFLAASPTGNAGVLTAGESVTVTIDFQSTTTNADIDFTLSQTDTSQPIDWTQIIADPNFATDFSNGAAALAYLQNETGPDWGGFVTLLDQDANLIPPQIGNPDNLKTLFNLSLQQALAAVNTSISGTLQSSDPAVTLAGQTIEATDTDTGSVYSTTILNDGSFVFATLPADTFTFSVNGLLLNAPPTVALTAGEALTGVQLSASEGAVIAGQVLAQATGTPIAGATVNATSEATGLGYNATADANGNYSISGLPAGVYDLVVNATGYAQAEIVGVDVSNGNAAEPVSLAVQSSLTGSITLASGGPAESTLEITANIDGSFDANQIYSTSSTTSSFELDGIPAGTYDVTVQLPGYITQTIADVVVAAGQAVDLGTLTLAPASEIDGVVTSTDPNNPAAQIIVQAWQNGALAAGAIADSEGNFQLTNLAPGTYTLVVPSAAVVTAPTVTVALGQTVTGVAIDVQPGGTIAGTVTDSNDVPLSGLTVDLSGPNGLSESTTTDGNGDYQFPGLAAADYEVYLSIGGAQTSQTVSITQVDGTSVTADLQLSYAATITGTLTDGSNNPITDGAVTLYQDGAAVAGAVTDAAGVYTFLVVQPGTFDLAAAASEGTFGTITGLMVADGSTVTQNFQLGADTLTVSVSDGAAAVTGDYAELESTIDGTATLVGQAVVAANGSATFANLVAGTYTVVVSAADGDFGQTTASVVDGGPNSANVSLSPQAAVTGTITDTSANPLSNATVVFQPSGDLQESYAALTAADGTYSITLAPGTYDVTIFADGFLADTQSGIVISSGAVVNDALTPSTTSITGTLVDGSGNPVPDGAVTVFDSAGHVIGVAAVQPDGSFALTTAAGNNLTLQVTVPNYAALAPITFSATAGTATALDPIVLQPVAVDPGGSSSPGGQTPSVPDGQLYADTVLQMAQDMNNMVQKITLLEMPPACPVCDYFYSIYKEAVQVVNVNVEIFQDDYDRVVAQDNRLNNLSERETETAQAHASLGNQNIPIAFLPTTSIYTVYLRPIQIAMQQALALIPQIATASDPGQIQSVAQQIQSLFASVSQLAAAGQAALNYDGLYQSLSPEGQHALAGVSVGLADVGNAPSNLFADTISYAYELQSVFAKLQSAFAIWQDAMAKYKTALKNLTLCEAIFSFCQPQPPPQRITHNETPNEVPKDPNALIGPAGVGTQDFIQPTAVLPYTIDFENDGSAAAQDVTVTEQLDPNLDWSTFQLGSFGWGPINVTVPAGLTQYETTVSYENSDGSALNVVVDLDFNVQTGLLTATFTSLDPTTGEAPTGVFDGFLYPEDGSGAGDADGFVQYTIQPNASLPTGTTISQQASVVFDINAALATNTVTNTIAAVVTQASLSEPVGTTTPATTKISTLLGTSYADPDANTKPGIAIISTTGTGTWQYSTNGMAWTSIAAVTTTSALLLPAADLLRFVPAGATAGQAQLLYVAWDGSAGRAGSYANAGAVGGATPFSANAGMLTVTVTPVNHAPTWTASSPAFTPVLPGTYSLSGAAPAGDSVSSLFGASFNDVDGNSVGIAVIGVTGTTHGTWQYSTDGGTTWTSFGSATTTFKAPAPTNALLLAGADLLRFVPSAGFTGAATLTAYAWDGTQGTAAVTGATTGFRITATGRSTAFSTTTLTATVQINAAPTLTATSITPFTAITEGAASVAVTAKTLLKDAGASGDATGVAIVGAGGTGGVGTGTWQYLLAGATTWTALPSVSQASGFLLPSTASLRFVSVSNQNGTATLTFLGWDGTAGTAGKLFAIAATGGATAISGTETAATLTVNPINHAPTWTGSTVALPTELGNSTPPGVLVSAAFGSHFSDIDGNPVGVAVIAATGTTSGAWEYSLDGTNWTTFGAATTTFKVPSLTNALLLPAGDLIRFVPNANFTGTATLTVLAWDGTQGAAAVAGATSGFRITADGGNTAFSSTSLRATVLVNLAPTLTTLTPAVFPTAIVEGAATAGVTVAALLTDAHASANAKGVAIVDAGGTGGSGTGTWQYLLAGTTTWKNLPAVSESSAFLLPSTASIRFQSVANQNGSAALTFLAWDETEGTAGTLFAIAAIGAATAFSSAAASATVAVNPINHAPTWTGSTVALPTELGNSTPPGVLVSAAFGNRFNDIDGNPVGIAVIGATGTANGTWEYSLDGSTWTTFGAATTTFHVPAASNALLLSAGDQLRFLPNANFTGTATLTVDAWDGTQGTAAAFGATAGFKIVATGAHTAFSSTSLTAAVLVNLAPTLASATAAAFPALVEGATTSIVTVATLLHDAGASAHAKGLAVVGATGTGGNGTGTWQYLLTGTNIWTPLPTVSETSAFLLPSTAELRFVSVSNQSGTAALTFRAWDETAGTAGQRFAISATGGATPISGTEAVASVAVNPINHAPAWNGTGASLTPILPGSYSLNGPTPPGNTVASVFAGSFTDLDGNAVGIAVTALTGTADGTWQYSLDGTTWLDMPTTGANKISLSAALLLAGSDFIRFVPNANFLGTATLTAYAWDGTTGTIGGTANLAKTGGSTAFSTTSLTATVLVNTAPVL